MKHQATAAYPAPAEVVLRMFLDEAFHVRKLTEVGIEHRILECSLSGDDFRIRVQRQIPVDLPGVKSLGVSKIVHVEYWNTATHCGTVDVELPGKPLTMHCKSAIEDHGDRCVVRYDWELNSRLPVVGRKLEKFIAANIDEQAEPEHQAGIELLDAYR